MAPPVPLYRADRRDACRDGGMVTHRGGFQRFRPLPLPDRVPMIVRDLFRIMTEQRISIPKLADKSGVHANTIHTWRSPTGRVPSISNFEAVANALGHKLCLTEIPPRITNDLEDV